MENLGAKEKGNYLNIAGSIGSRGKLKRRLREVNLKMCLIRRQPV